MPSPTPESSATRLVLVTFPDEETARQIGTLLIERKLAACITLIPSTSIYSWEDKIHTAPETQALIKTSATTYPALQKTLASEHPYDTPEIIALTPTDGLPSYLQWVITQSTPTQ